MTQDALMVREFTAGAGQRTPDVPEPFGCDQALFLCKMMLDEIMELTATVATPEHSKASLKSFISDCEVPDNTHAEEDTTEVIATQALRLVRAYAVSQAAAVKQGMNLSSLFGLVHAANMAKRDPVTKQFLKREDGKIIKPKGWQPPDIEGEMARQLQDGSFGAMDGESAIYREMMQKAGIEVPTHPVAFTEEQVFEVAKKMVQEIVHFGCTVVPTSSECKEKLKDFIDQSKDIAKEEHEALVNLVSNQCDALVDSYYYSLNSCARHGMNLSSLHALVLETAHGPVTPDMLTKAKAEMRRQLVETAFPDADSDEPSENKTTSTKTITPAEQPESRPVLRETN